MKHRYPFTNAIVFALVMRDPGRCRQLLQTIFPHRQVREVKIHEDYIDEEHTILTGIESRSIRLDVLFGDSDAWYDIEMQVRDEHDLPRRSRYSHASLDVRTLKRGQEFNDLKTTYVIFLCCFDCFGENRPIYSFEMYDVKNGLPLEDGTITIILNSRAEGCDMPEALQQLYRYMNEEVVSDSNPFIREIDSSVDEWNSAEKVNIIMTLEQEILIKENRARKEGRKEGIDIGIKKGIGIGRKEGVDIGRKEGIGIGRTNALAELVRDQILTLSQAAEKAGMSESEFRRHIEDQNADDQSGGERGADDQEVNDQSINDRSADA